MTLAKPPAIHLWPVRHLQEARERLGFPRTEAARFLGCTVDVMKQMEEGKRGSSKKSRDLIRRYCQWLKSEAESQADARLKQWLGSFEVDALCPQDELNDPEG